jgi:hypothetical protein
MSSQTQRNVWSLSCLYYITKRERKQQASMSQEKEPSEYTHQNAREGEKNQTEQLPSFCTDDPCEEDDEWRREERRS